MKTTVTIVGAGAMAQAHAAILSDLGRPCRAVCRSGDSARRFTETTGTPARAGGLEALLAEEGAPERAIVAAPVADLARLTRLLLAAGCRSILVEKPAGVTPREIAEIADDARGAGAVVHVAYNRRFYASVAAARRLIAEDGGVRSFFFEFTEIGDRVGRLPYPPEVLARWEIANSTHVVDTAFHLGGRPRHIEGRVTGGLPWHPTGDRWVGHGETETGAVFSYVADWDAPGRWGIELNTRARRLVLRPMESLQEQLRGSFALQPVAIDDEIDRRFKPGLHAQMSAWLGLADATALIDIAEHAESMNFLDHTMFGSE